MGRQPPLLEAFVILYVVCMCGLLTCALLMLGMTCASASYRRSRRKRATRSLVAIVLIRDQLQEPQLDTSDRDTMRATSCNKRKNLQEEWATS